MRAARRGSPRWETDDQLARDRAPARPGCRASPSRPPAPRSPPAGRCWCRCPAPATCPGWPARSAGRRPAAGTAPGRWRCRAAGSAGRAGAGLPQLPLVRAGRAGVPLPGVRLAPAAGRGGRGRAHRRGAGPGLPRQPRCAPPAAARGARRGARPARRWWSPPRAPSRAADGGYGAALLLDGWALLAARTCGSPRRRCGAGSPRPRWCVPHGDGGRVVVVADAALPAVQALVRWDPAGHAAAELAARAEVGFPPAVRMAAVEGTADAVAEVLDAVAGRAAERPGPRWRCSVRSSSTRAGRRPAPGPPRAGAAAGAPRPRAGRWPRRWPPRRPAAPRARRPTGAGAAGPGRRSADPRSRGRPVAVCRVAESTRGGVPTGADGGSRVGAGARRRARPAPPLPTVDEEIRAHPARPAVRRSGAAHPAAEVATFDTELRRLVADLTDTMLDEGGAGLAAPQLGVGLRVFTYDGDGFAGHLVNPTSRSVGDEEQHGPEGCLSIPGMSWDCRRHLHVVARGLRHARRAGDGRGQRDARPLHPARDRPPRRRAVRRPARPGDAQAGDGRDPRRGVVRGPPRPRVVKVSPHPLFGKAR